MLWGDAVDGTRWVIGELWRDSKGFAFCYGRDLEVARGRGFQFLPEFPDAHADVYRSRYLFATFAQRIPSPKRADTAKIIQSWGVIHADNPLEVLAVSGGVQMTDRIELAEFRSEDDDLSTPLDIRVAGMKHYEGRDHVSKGDELTLVRERSNQRDPYASVLHVRSGQKLGYVPRQYSPLVAHHLDGGAALRAYAVRQLTFPADAGRWIVRLQRSTG